MQDESLIDEMREALRGDRERAEVRRRGRRDVGTPTSLVARPEGTGRRTGLLARLVRLSLRS